MRTTFEKHPMSREKEIRTELEQIHRMMLDTKAQIAQVKEDATEDLSRVKELVSLNTILRSLEEKENAFKEELEELNSGDKKETL
jgi:small-conductance mechanosensitive channel